MTETEAEIRNVILWLESLRDAIDDGDLISAIQAIEAALALKRRELRGHD